MNSQIISQKNSLIISLTKQVFLPLIIGVFIYLFFRPNQTIGESYINWNIEPIYNFNNSVIGNILVGSLPDFLWLLSLLGLMNIIWDSNIPFILKALLYSLPIFTELLQYLKIITGTGDFYDIAAYLLAIFIFNLKLFFNPKTKTIK